MSTTSITKSAESPYQLQLFSNFPLNVPRRELSFPSGSLSAASCRHDRRASARHDEDLLNVR